MIDPAWITFAAFEFVSLPMLGWLAAAALPWLIHRRYRQQHLTTSWAAVELLMAAMRQRSRRVQMQQWLLLSIRTAILICVGLAAAEPGLRGWASGLNGTSRTHRIVVLDQSFSMGCESDGTTRFQRAKTQMREWIKTSAGDPLTLIRWGQQAESLLGRPTSDTSIVLAALEELQLSNQTCDLATALRSVNLAIERCVQELPQIAEHQVMFCTDFCQPTWTFNAQQQESLTNLGKKASVTMVDVSEERHPNIAVTEIQVEPQVLLRQRETTVSAKIENYGLDKERSTQVEFFIDDQLVESQVTQLQPNQPATVQFTHRFVNQGAKALSIRLPEVKDSLAIDNRRLHVVEIRPQLRIACLAGFPGAADDLARALTPSHDAAERSITAEVFPLSRLAELDLSDYAAVFLCSADHLTEREVNMLDRYVRQGGGLALFLSEEISTNASETWQAMLPVAIEEEVQEGQFKFDTLEYQHPIVEPFRGRSQSGLLGVVVSSYRRISMHNDRDGVETVLRFDTGDPAIVVGNRGMGHVAAVALPTALAARTNGGSPWSTWPISPSFLPIVRELTIYLISQGREQHRNLLVGEPALLAQPSTHAPVEVRTPDGRELSLSSDFELASELSFLNTQTSGIYRFSAEDKEIARLAFNLDDRESDLRPAKRTNLPPGFLEQSLNSSADGQFVQRDFSFVRVLLFGALVLLLVEIGLAWMLGRGWG